MNMFFEFINGPVQRDDPDPVCLGEAVIYYCWEIGTIICVPDTPIAGCDFAPVLSVACINQFLFFDPP